MSLFARPSLTRRITSRSTGVSDSHPLEGRLRSPRPRCAYAITSSVDSAAPSVHPASKSLLPERCSRHSHRRFVVGVVHLEADLSGPLPDPVCRPEQAGRMLVSHRHQQPGARGTRRRREPADTHGSARRLPVNRAHHALPARIHPARAQYGRAPAVRPSCASPPRCRRRRRPTAAQRRLHRRPIAPPASESCRGRRSRAVAP